MITSLSLNPYAQQLRKNNIEAIFGPNVVTEYQFLDTGADKTKILKEYGKIYPGAYWLEDKVANAIDGKNAGLNSLLIKHIHLKEEDTDGIPVMSDWSEVYERIVSGR